MLPTLIFITVDFLPKTINEVFQISDTSGISGTRQKYFSKFRNRLRALRTFIKFTIRRLRKIQSYKEIRGEEFIILKIRFMYKYHYKEQKKKEMVDFEDEIRNSEIR